GKQAGEKNLIDNMEVDRYLEENRDKVKKRFRVPGFVKREYTDVIESEILPLTKKNYIDRKSTRLNSSHVSTSYAVFCLKKKTMGATARVGGYWIEVLPTP